MAYDNDFFFQTPHPSILDVLIKKFDLYIGVFSHSFLVKGAPYAYAPDRAWYEFVDDLKEFSVTQKDIVIVVRFGADRDDIERYIFNNGVVSSKKATLVFDDTIQSDKREPSFPTGQASNQNSDVSVNAPTGRDPSPEPAESTLQFGTSPSSLCADDPAVILVIPNFQPEHFEFICKQIALYRKVLRIIEVEVIGKSLIVKSHSLFIDYLSRNCNFTVATCVIS